MVDEQTNLRELLDSIENAYTPNERKLKLLELAKLSLSYAALEAGDLSGVPESGLSTRFFIHFLDISDIVHNFFEIAAPFLDPKYKGKDLEKEIMEKNRELKGLLAKDLKAQYEHLLEIKDKLCDELSQYKQMEREVEELKKIQEMMAPEAMEKLRQNNIDLKATTDGKRPELDALLLEKKNLNDALFEIESQIATLNESRPSSVDAFVKLSSVLGSMLDKTNDNEDERLFKESVRLRKKIEQYQDIAKRLDECLSGSELIGDAEKEYLNLYKRHLLANETITQNASSIDMSNTPPSVVALTQEAIDLSKGIRESLIKYDDLLQTLITMRENIVKNIGRLNMAQ